MPIDVSHLARVPVLATLDPKHLSELANWFEVEDVDDGRHLTTQGAAGYAFYVVDAGRFTVEHDGVVVRTLALGDHFGEISILGGGRRTATVTAQGPGRVLTLFGTRFRELQAASPEVAGALADSMRERLERDAADL